MSSTSTSTKRWLFTNNSSSTTTTNRAKFEKPTRPLSAYNYFFREERKRMRLEEPHVLASLSFTGLAKYLGNRWKRTAEADRTRYQLWAAQDKARYSNELIAWQEEQEEFCARLEEEEEEERQRIAREQAREAAAAAGAVALAREDEGGVEEAALYYNAFAPAASFPVNVAERDAEGYFTYENDFKMHHQQLQDYNAYDDEWEPVPLFTPESFASALFFDERQNLAHMARSFGYDGVKYLLGAVSLRHEG